MPGLRLKPEIWGMLGGHPVRDICIHLPQQDELWKSSRWIQYHCKKCRSQQSKIKPVKSVNTTYRANTSSWILLNSVKLCPLWIPMETTSPRSPVLRFHLGTSGFDVFSCESSWKAKLFIYHHWTWKNLRPVSTVDCPPSSTSTIHRIYAYSRCWHSWRVKSYLRHDTLVGYDVVPCHG